MSDVSAPPLNPAQPLPATPFQVFISYSRKDKKYLDAFVEHLASLEGQWITIWTDQVLEPGEQWEPKLLKKLNEADLIVLLVSSSFIASRFIQDVELARALERFEEGKTLIVPVLVRDVFLPREHALRQFQMLPSNGVPVTSTRKRHDQVWTEVAAALHRRLRSIELARRNSSSEAASLGPLAMLWRVEAREGGLAVGGGLASTRVQSQALKLWLSQLQLIPVPWYGRLLRPELKFVQGTVLGLGLLIGALSLLWLSNSVRHGETESGQGRQTATLSGGAEGLSGPTLSPLGGSASATGQKLQQASSSNGNETGLDIQWISLPGTGPDGFMMGSPDGEGSSTEHPRHKVTVPAFQMSKTEVTVAQYRACVQAKGEGCTEPDSKDKYLYCNWGYPDRDNHPINCIDWNQARAFAAWAGARLPTEAEWEYAATGGGKTIYSGTDDLSKICEYGNVADQTAKAVNKDLIIVGCTDGYAETAPVGRFKDGAWGLKDLTGNVWEWVEDCYEKDYTDAPSDGSARTECLSLSQLCRGGGWTSNGFWLRAADRGGYEILSGSSPVRIRNGRKPGRRDVDVGFRVARGGSAGG